MAEVITTALLKVVFDKLSSEITTEFGKLIGLNKQLRKLESTLSTIQDVLEDAEARQVKEKALKGWLRKLKDVAYDADDVLDEVAAKAVKWRPDREYNLTEKVRNLLSISKSPVFCRKIANRINEIMEKLDEIAEERSKFHLREGFVSNSETDSSVRETGSLIEESEVYGRHEEKEKIVDFLFDVFDEPKPAVIAIVGLGGIGKTTVAQLAYNDERVCKHFEKRIWVSVPMDFDNKKLCRSIIESVTGREYNLTDIDLMQRSLNDHLANKKFLLVLDDVWSENQGKWDGLRIALTSGTKGSKIVVTTRSQRVASVMGSAAQCLLTGLSEDECLALFEKRAFGVGGAEKTPNLEAIGREIVKKCGGVPLAAKALGSLMHFRREESMWLAVKDSEIWRLSDDDDNGILPALKLSYDHLPPHLKQCFAYCSIFPRAFGVSKKTLVRLWIAEGFIRSPGRNGNLEDLGFLFVDELLSRSFFQNYTELGGVAGKLKMHDLVHDLARSIAGDECSIIDASTGRGITQSLHYSSFICDGEILSNLEPLREARMLRTFHLIASQSISVDHHKAEELLHVLLSSSRVLRALHLSNLPIKSLPNSIKKLRHLRYLNLSHTHLDMLPPDICTLHNLEILDLSSCKCLKSLPKSIGSLLNLLSLNLCQCFSLLSLPSSIGRLQKLRNLDLSFCPIKTLPTSLSCLSNLQMLHLNSCGNMSELPKNIKDMRNLVQLDLCGCYGLTCMPVGIGQLSHLRTLSRFVLGGKSKCSITELGALNLEDQLEITRLENVSSIAEARKANLKEKCGIQTLGLSWNDSVFVRMIQEFQGTDDGEESLESCIEVLRDQWDIYSKTAEDVLEALQPHTSLKKLSINSFEGRTLPLWLMKLSLPILTRVSLSSCIRCTRLPAFGQLPCLEVLTLRTLPAIKCLGSEFYGGNNAFPLLKELNLSGMSELEEWQCPSDGDVFPGLAKLSLLECPKLRALPSTFPSVVNLNMNVDDRLLLSSLQNGAFPNVKHLSIENFDDDVGLPEPLSDLMSSVESYTVRRKPKPSSDDSTSMSSSGFGYAKIYGGVTTMELPIW